MNEELAELVRVDSTGTAHPVGKTASQRMRARQGSFRLMPSPSHLVVMRYVGEDGRRDPEDGPIFRLSGEITADGALCDVFGLIGQAGWPGELVVLDGHTSRSIFFDRSHVIGAHSSAEGERLGEVLYRYGALTSEQVEETAKHMTQDVRFGEAAVRLGFITRERLFQLMTKQTEEIVYAMLLVGDGMFYFLDTFDESRITARQSLSVNGLLMEGVRRMDETRYFRERIPSDQHVPEVLPDRAAPDDELRTVYDAIDGHRNVAEIGRLISMGEFEVTQALFQLVQSGRIVVRAPRPTGPAATVALFNEAMRNVHNELTAIGKWPEVREQLSSFATGAGIYDALFRRGGPQEDGSLVIETIVENVTVMVGPGQAESMLAQWLYEYISFAVFVAEPFLRQHEAGAAARKDGPPSQPLSKRLSTLIAPLARVT
ncbi:MAG: DUF4388 domain-containing protein [Polyangiaceae bacterium]|nr:DUF4388 domain-containing protein [Polyangiaceae bacterium]